MHRIVVNIKNEVGALARLTTLLADHGINIVSINTQGMDETGVVIITTEDEDHDRALWQIADAGYKAISDEALVVRLHDESGALARVADRFRRADVNILSLHIVNRSGDYTTVSISADDMEKARDLVSDESIGTPQPIDAPPVTSN